MTTITVSPGESIQRALDRAQPGDIVLVAPGTYAEALNIGRGGAKGAPVTLRAEKPIGAIIRPPASAWNAVSVNADYVTIEGFTVAGARGDGIEANNRHHLTVRGCLIFDCNESGIQTNGCDVVTIDDNEIGSCAKSGWFSGISLYQHSVLTDDAPAGPHRNFIRGNRCHHNITPATVADPNQHSDGNGIIIDDFQHTQNGSAHPSYPHRTLVEDNICHDNGGKGIQVTWSDHVDVWNNTVVRNNQDAKNPGTWRGDLSCQESNDCSYRANIAVCDGRNGNTAIGSYSREPTPGPNKNIIWDRNITFGGGVKLDGGNNYDVALNFAADPKLGPDLFPGSLALLGNVGARPRGTVVTPPAPDKSVPPRVVVRVALSKARDAAGKRVVLEAIETATGGTAQVSAGGDVVFTGEFGGSFTYATKDGSKRTVTVGAR